MNQKKKTRMALILDRSSSMETTKEQAVQGLNEQVAQAKEWSKSQDILCSLVTFNGDVFEHLWDAPADSLQEAKAEDYVPMGSTSMFDAIGYTVKKLLDTRSEEDEEVSYFICIISDGETNSDRYYRPDMLKELIGGCQNTKRWTFVYMGCNDAYLHQVASSTGIPIGNMGSWMNQTMGGTLVGMQNLRCASNKYYAERDAGQIGTQSLMECASKSSEGIADFQQETNPEQWAATPKVEQAVEVDLTSVLQKQPTYSNVVMTNSTNGGLFANTVGVIWDSTTNTNRSST